MAIRVLLVEDEPALRESMTQILIQYGYKVISAPDGQTGVALLKKDTNFALVITHLDMPKIEGLTIMQHIKQQCPLAPVIVSSAVRDITLMNQLFDQGMTAFLRRPFSLKELLELVQEILNSD